MSFTTQTSKDFPRCYLRWGIKCQIRMYSQRRLAGKCGEKDHIGFAEIKINEKFKFMRSQYLIVLFILYYNGILEFLIWVTEHCIAYVCKFCFGGKD